MDYQIRYEEGKPAVLEFSPDAKDSKGVYNWQLMYALLEENKINGWTWDRKEQVLSREVGDLDFKDMMAIISEVQYQITMVLDELLRWKKAEEIWQKYKEV